MLRAGPYLAERSSQGRNAFFKMPFTIWSFPLVKS